MRAFYWMHLICIFAQLEAGSPQRHHTQSALPLRQMHGAVACIRYFLGNGTFKQTHACRIFRAPLRDAHGVTVSIAQINVFICAMVRAKDSLLPVSKRVVLYICVRIRNTLLVHTNRMWRNACTQMCKVCTTVRFICTPQYAP